MTEAEKRQAQFLEAARWWREVVQCFPGPGAQPEWIAEWSKSLLSAETAVRTAIFAWLTSLDAQEAG